MDEPRRAAVAHRQASGRAGQSGGLTGSAGGLPADAVEVGRIVEPWGLQGWLRVQPYAADAAALLAARRWFAVGLDGTATLAIRSVRRQGDGLVAKAADIDDRSVAERLAGARLLVGRSDFPATADDEYYWADLIGCAVVNRDGVALGTVADLIDNGPQSVLRLLDDDGVERLIPFVAAHVDTVDIGARRIVVDWGLDY